MTANGAGGRVAGRNLAALSAAQILGSTGLGLVLTIATITASELSGSDMIAALAQTSTIVGSALFTIPVARVAERFGRRASLAGAYVVSTIGMVIGGIAVVASSWPVLLVGLLLGGTGMLAGLAARFAASDSARSPAEIPKFIAYVLWASTIGSVLGPNLIGPLNANGVVDGKVLTLAMAGVLYLLAAAAVWWGARDVGVGAKAADAPGRAGATAQADEAVASRPRVAELLRLPGAARGIGIAALAHAVMVGLMGLAPVQLHHGGVDAALVGVAMSGHLAGMYAFSPVFGIAVSRFGAGPVTIGSFAMLVVAALVLATSPHDDAWRFTLGLFLLGVGWSMALVAGSTMVTSSVAPEARIAVQGFTDFAIMVAGAGASIVGGIVVGTVGYEALSWGAIGLVAFVAVALAAPVSGFRRTSVVADTVPSAGDTEQRRSASTGDER